MKTRDRCRYRDATASRGQVFKRTQRFKRTAITQLFKRTMKIQRFRRTVKITLFSWGPLIHSFWRGQWSHTVLKQQPLKRTERTLLSRKDTNFQEFGEDKTFQKHKENTAFQVYKRTMLHLCWRATRQWQHQAFLTFSSVTGASKPAM